MEAVAEAKEHVRARVGALTLAFDSAGEVYRRALKIVTGKEPPKNADAATLRYAFDALPAKEGTNRRTYAMDSAESVSSVQTAITARSPDLMKNLNRIGRA